MITIIFVERCEGWYRNAKHLGNRAVQIAKQYAVLSAAPRRSKVRFDSTFYITSLKQADS